MKIEHTYYAQLKDPDMELYDSIVDGIATFGGIVVFISVRYATVTMVPFGGVLWKKILAESGSIAVATAAANMTSICIKGGGELIKSGVMKFRK